MVYQCVLTKRETYFLGVHAEWSARNKRPHASFACFFSIDNNRTLCLISTRSAISSTPACFVGKGFWVRRLNSLFEKCVRVLSLVLVARTFAWAVARWQRLGQAICTYLAHFRSASFWTKRTIVSVSFCSIGAFWAYKPGGQQRFPYRSFWIITRSGFLSSCCVVPTLTCIVALLLCNPPFSHESCPTSLPATVQWWL